MSGLTYIIIGGVLALAGSVITTVGINKLKRQEEAISLSVPPTIEIILQSNQDIMIENTGQHELIDVRVSPICYVITKDPMKVLIRSPSFDFEVAKSLKPRGQVTFALDKIRFIFPEEYTDKGIEMLALVVVFRREQDNKRYVEIEPFLTEKISGKQTLFALYSDRGSGSSSGPPGFIISAIKEITETERLFFRAK